VTREIGLAWLAAAVILKAVARKRTAFWGEGCGCWQLLPRATIPRGSLGDNPIKAFLLLP